MEEKAKVNTKTLGLVWRFSEKMVIQDVSVVGGFLLSSNQVISFYSALGMTSFFWYLVGFILHGFVDPSTFLLRIYRSWGVPLSNIGKRCFYLLLS